MGATPEAPRTPAPSRQQTRVRDRPPPRSAPAARPAHLPARPAAADPTRETPDKMPSNSRSRRYWSNLPATNQPSLPVTTGRSCIDQRRLAHPRRAADQHTATSSRQRILERRLQRRHLVVAADQPRRPQPQRNIMLTDPRCARRAPFGQPRRSWTHPVRGLVAVVGLLFQQMHDDRRQRLRARPGFTSHGGAGTRAK